MRTLVEDDRALMKRRCLATLEVLHVKVQSVSTNNDFIGLIRYTESLSEDSFPFVEGIPMGVMVLPNSPVPLEFKLRAVLFSDWKIVVDSFQVSDSDGMFLLLRNEYADLFRKQIYASMN